MSDCVCVSLSECQGACLIYVCLFGCLSVFLDVNLSGLLSLSRPGWLSGCFLSVYLMSRCLTVCLSHYLDFMSVCLGHCHSGCLSGWLYGYFLFGYLSIWISNGLDSICPTLWMCVFYIRISLCLEVWMKGYLSICLDVCLCKNWDTWINVYLYRCLSVCLDVYVSVFPS